MACVPLPCLFPVSCVQRLRSLGRLGLVALFFFPGVGVVDDQVGQGELAGGLGGGDQAVDGLRVPGEGIGGCSTPRRGQRDFTVLMRVRAIEHGPPPLRGRVVVADQPRVGVEIHAFLPHRTRGRGHKVRSAITPTPLITRSRERDRDVMAQKVDHVGLGGTGDRNDGRNVFVSLSIFLCMGVRGRG